MHFRYIRQPAASVIPFIVTVLILLPVMLSQRLTDPFAVGWPHNVYTNGIDSVLPISRRTNRSSITQRYCADTNLPSEPLFPATGLPSLIVGDCQGMYLVVMMTHLEACIVMIPSLSPQIPIDIPRPCIPAVDLTMPRS